MPIRMVVESCKIIPRYKLEFFLISFIIIIITKWKIMNVHDNHFPGNPNKIANVTQNACQRRYKNAVINYPKVFCFVVWTIVILVPKIRI